MSGPLCRFTWNLVAYVSLFLLLVLGSIVLVCQGQESFSDTEHPIELEDAWLHALHVANLAWNKKRHGVKIVMNKNGNLRKTYISPRTAPYVDDHLPDKSKRGSPPADIDFPLHHWENYSRGDANW